MQYNHGQSGQSGNGNGNGKGSNSSASDLASMFDAVSGTGNSILTESVLDVSALLLETETTVNATGTRMEGACG